MLSGHISPLSKRLLTLDSNDASFIQKKEVGVPKLKEILSIVVEVTTDKISQSDVSNN